MKGNTALLSWWYAMRYTTCAGVPKPGVFWELRPPTF